MSESFDLHDVDFVTIGVVGQPGQRAFFLQARAGSEYVTLKIEKVQVAAMATSVQELLANLPQPSELPPPPEFQPLEPVFVVGEMGLAYDKPTDRVLLVVEEAVPEGVEPAVARFTLTREQVASLAIGGRLLVEGGRPPCPVCAYPLDPTGHVCPRLNGNRPPLV